MDKPMNIELEKRFDQLTRQAEEKFADTYRRIDENSRRIDKNSQRIEALRVETMQRFDKTDQRLDGLDERVRHTNVMVEDLRSDVKLIAEGFSTMNHKLDRVIEAVDAGRQRDDELDLRIRRLEAAQAGGL